jgi:hypothetical protein
MRGWHAVGTGFRKLLRPGDVLLVVDVGGGTTDFSAIAVLEQDGALVLERIAVGEHILLGGDNMDLALAFAVKQKLEAQGKTVDRWALGALAHGARGAKERLLSEAELASVPIAIAGKGSQLFGSALRSELTRDEVTKLLVDGFFPLCRASDRPTQRARTALTQLGLPYAQDAAVTRHLAAFLAKQAEAAERLLPGQGGGRLLRPTAVLWNGGVMKAEPLRARVLEALTSWLAEEGAPPPRVLEGGDLDHAVAKGAAAYALARRGKGLRIRGGTARAYYVGIESAMPAVPGMEPPTVALCVAPFGLEEGSPAAAPAQELGAVVGEPVRFRFFASTTRREDRAGAEIDDPEQHDIEELAPIEVTLPIHTAEGASTGRREGEVVPVRVAARVTEVGTLLLEAIPLAPRFEGERWKVELSVRTE